MLLALHTYANSYLHLPALLAEAGFKVDLVARPGNPVLASRFVDRSFRVAGNDSAFAAEVNRHLATGDYDALQLCDEPALLALFAQPDREPPARFRPFSDARLAVGAGRKDHFHEWCAVAGLPTPRTLRVDSWEALESAVTAFGLPCYVKGSTGSGGQSVRRVASLADLSAATEALAGHGPWLVQEAIDGPTGGVQFVAHRGRLLGWFALYKRVMLGDARGPTLVGELCAPPGLEEICARACSVGGLNGLHGFDFMQTRDGRVLLIDPHLGRCTPMIHFGPLCGVNLAAVWHAAFAGQQKELSRPTRRGAVFLKYPEILEHICAQGPRAAWRDLRPWRGRLHVGWGHRRDLFAVGLASTRLLIARAKIFAGSVRRRLLLKG